MAHTEGCPGCKDCIPPPVPGHDPEGLYRTEIEGCRCVCGGRWLRIRGGWSHIHTNDTSEDYLEPEDIAAIAEEPAVVGAIAGDLATAAFQNTLLDNIAWIEEKVDHPAHYGGADNPYEAIKVIDAWTLGFCLGNTVKYICRAGKKHRRNAPRDDTTSKLEDLRKAQWYLNHEIERLEAGMNNDGEDFTAVARQIDLKHHITRDGRLIKTGNGVEVPADEPLILFRGRDRLAVRMLEFYRVLCVEDGCNDFQLGQVDELINRFKAFAATSNTMKQPGVTRGK